jgi:hypothetical protein
MPYIVPLMLSGAEYVYSRIASSFHGRCPFIVIEMRRAAGGRTRDALDCQWEEGRERILLISSLSHQRSQSASGMKGLNKAAHKELQQLTCHTLIH